MKIKTNINYLFNKKKKIKKDKKIYVIQYNGPALYNYMKDYLNNTKKIISYSKSLNILKSFTNLLYALKLFYENNIFHNDIKLDNIIYNEADIYHGMKFIDFGHVCDFNNFEKYKFHKNDIYNINHNEVLLLNNDMLYEIYDGNIQYVKELLSKGNTYEIELSRHINKYKNIIKKRKDMLSIHLIKNEKDRREIIVSSIEKEILHKNNIYCLFNCLNQILPYLFIKQNAILYKGLNKLINRVTSDKLTFVEKPNIENIILTYGNLLNKNIQGGFNYLDNFK